MDSVAESLDQAADSLSALAREVPGLEAAPGAFAARTAAPVVGASLLPAGGAAIGEVGRTDADRIAQTGLASAGRGAHRTALGWDASDGPGLPGRVGRALHGRWAAALEARAHEASAAAARLAALAVSVRATQRAYTDTDEAVRRRFTREM